MLIGRILQHIIGRRKNGNGVFLYTLGYQGLSPKDFVNRLKENDIKVLVDVREISWSKKIGFSKSQLENIISQHGIKYVHMRKLGSPSPIRKKLKENADYESFFIEYGNYLNTQMQELEDLRKITNDAICCLMCFEKDANLCHRKIIASEINKRNNNGLKVIHL